MRAMYSLVLKAAAVAVLATCASVRASEIGAHIESSAKKSSVFKTYPKGDGVKIESNDGVVALTVTGSYFSSQGVC